MKKTVLQKEGRQQREEMQYVWCRVFSHFSSLNGNWNSKTFFFFAADHKQTAGGSLLALYTNNTDDSTETMCYIFFLLNCEEENIIAFVIRLSVKRVLYYFKHQSACYCVLLFCCRTNPGSLFYVFFIHCFPLSYFLSYVNVYHSHTEACFS